MFNIIEKIIGSDDLEEDRYDKKASLLKNSFSKKNTSLKNNSLGLNNIPSFLRDPYKIYIETLKRNLNKEYTVLEIACGTGNLSEVLIKNSKEVYFLDISKNSIEVLKKNFSKYRNFKCLIAKMDNIPLKDSSFDLITTAGSLSYANHKKLFNEINRLLKPEGKFICVDTLNNNPIYMLPRVKNIFFLKRSIITFFRLPNFFTIFHIKRLFLIEKINYIGHLTFINPLLILLFGKKNSNRISQKFDRIFNSSFFAYKFVLESKKKQLNLYK